MHCLFFINHFPVAVVHHYEEGPKGNVLSYGEEIEEKLAKLEVMMQVAGKGINPRGIY